MEMRVIRESDTLATATRPEGPVKVLVPEKVSPVAGRFILHPAVRDFGLTGSSSFLAAVAAMLVIALLGRKLGPALLGEYLLIRRMASWLQAGVQLPSGVALPRYVAFHNNGALSIRQTYFIAALSAGCGIALLLGTILIIWRRGLSHLFFGNAPLEHLVVPLGLLLLGLAAHGAVFGYYQGTLAMGKACALQVANLVIVPILATVFLMQRHSISLIVIVIGASMIGCTCLFALPIVYKMEGHVSAKQIKSQTVELLSYGFARVAGDFGLQAMLSLPAVIALHYLPIRAVSCLLLGGSFLAAVAAATLPLGTILLSRVSRSVAEMRTSQLRLRIAHFISALMGTAALACLQMIVFSDVILRVWVGPGFQEGIRVVQITILAVPFYFVYAGLRCVIDAAVVKAYNTRNILIAAVVFLLVVLLIGSSIPHAYLLEGLAASGVVGLAVLAFCTLQTVRQLFQVDLQWVRVLPEFGLAILLGAISFFLHYWLNYQPGVYALLLYETMLAGFYLIVLWKLRLPWVHFLWSTLFLGAALNQEISE